MRQIALTDSVIEQFSPGQEQREIYDQSFPGPGSFGVRIGKGGRKSFFMIYPLHGRRIRLTLGSFPVLSLQEAKREALAVLKQTARGKNPAAEKRRYRRAPTFAELARRFLKEHAEPQCSPATTAEYRRMLKRDLLPLWDHRKPQDITTAEVKALLRDVANVRKSPIMSNRLRLLISKLFNFGIEQSLVAHNPARDTRPPAAAQTREFALSLEELRAVWDQLGQEPLPVQTAFKLMLLTGQRPGDVLKMRWTDITIDTWMVGSSLTPHRVYLCPPAQQLLKTLHQQSLTKSIVPEPDSDYVFSGKRGVPIRYLRKAAARISRKLPDLPDWSPSDFRRTFELRIRELGIRPDVVAVVLNQRTALRKLKVLQSDYNYYPEVQQALSRWMRAIVPKPGGSGSSQGGAKVIPLFGN